MAPFKQDSRSTTIVNPPSISAPRRLNSQVERPSKLPFSTLASQTKGRGQSDVCYPSVDRVRRRTDSVSSTTSTITISRPQSKLHSIIISASSFRRHSSDETRPSSGISIPKLVRSKTTPAKSVVEFPRVVSTQSSIPLRSLPALKINQRKRLLSRNEEEDAQPRVRPRLRSAISSPKFAPSRGSSKSDQDPSRSVSVSVVRSLDPRPGGPAKGVVNVTDVKRSTTIKGKSSITTIRPVESKDESQTRKPFTHTQVFSVPDISKSYLLNLDSVVDGVLPSDSVTLTYRYNDETMDLEDIEEIPDLPLSRPPSVAKQNSPNSAKSNLERFDVKILSAKDTEVWDTDENGVYAWEGCLCVTDNMVKAIWASTPPVDCVNLECRARESPSSPNTSLSSSASSISDYQVTYQGQSLHEDEVLKFMDYTKGITVNKKWERQYSYQEPNKVEWRLKFWVPISMALFQKLEERQFRLRAKLTFRDPSAGGMKIVAHSGSVDMRISSLKTAKFVPPFQ